MMGLELLVALCACGVAPILGVPTVRRRNQRRWQDELVAYELRFPRGLDPAAVSAFLSGLSGLVAHRLMRPFVVRAVMFEVSATAAGIRHYLLVPKSLSQVALSALRAAMPSVGAHPDSDYRGNTPVLAAELGLSHHGRSLATDQAVNVSTALLASLLPLKAGEELRVQWSLSPLGPVALTPRVTQPPIAVAVWDLLNGRSELRSADPEVVKAARTKERAPLFAATIRVGVTAGPARSRSLLLRTLAAFHTANAPGAHLQRLERSSRRVGQALRDYRLPLLSWPCTLNSLELAGLLAFPAGAVVLPGLRLGGARQLAPAADVPAAGRVVAQATFPGAERPVALSVTESMKHLHVIGPTGSGKSSLLCGLVAQDMAAGHGVLVIEPSGDLISEVLDRVPVHRIKDVVILDPADETRPVGFNVLAGAETAPELVVDQVVGIFHDLYRTSWGPRTDDILRSALLTLVSEPGATLVDLPLLLTDPGFRRRLVGRVNDPVALGPFWAWYEALSDAERAQAIGPVMNKLRAFLLRRRLRNVLGQAEPAFDLEQALADRRIVLVPLTKGVLGEEAAALIGALVVARSWQAVLRRSAVAPADRPVTFAYVDEFQNYLRLPTSIADVLAEARKLKFGLTLAHQHLGQLPTEMQKAVLANARSRVIFQVSAADAKVLASELKPHLAAEDLQGLGAYEVAVSLSAGARIAPPLTGQTLLPPAPTGNASAARQHSRQTYGRDLADVEAAIRERHEGRLPGGGTGRREVRS
ncbi:type IV secretion system coupling TraD/TrwB family protein [Kribbella sp. VKM Ac-2527]|uniref:Type IV secretion system coupling TraD/TrwB family protein n=1 Tax=Kribbella caucasensis TaxID=2512215 RepID=A0A4R6J8G4_9ACTN|nr:type IV secretion system DNA-binding domain-containing protein [Kribbella sp. VKM Ac-2527]TDO30686.1 type IV secretion system coupling TraD/TrwB family protein [Kribbella sp. VKM Ac-2527]